MPKLFEIAQDMRALDELIDESGGELSPEVEAAWESMASGLYEQEAAKAEYSINWIRKLESEAAAARAEAEQYLKHATTRENRVKRIKAMWLMHLESTGRGKIETATQRVLARQANGGVTPVILAENLDPSTIPDDLVIVRRVPDLEAIRKRLEAIKATPVAPGEPGQIVAIPGVAVLGERGFHLRIR